MLCDKGDFISRLLGGGDVHEVGAVREATERKPGLARLILLVIKSTTHYEEGAVSVSFLQADSQ